MGRRAGWRMGDGPRDNVQFLSGLVAPLDHARRRISGEKRMNGVAALPASAFRRVASEQLLM